MDFIRSMMACLFGRRGEPDPTPSEKLALYSDKTPYQPDMMTYGAASRPPYPYISDTPSYGTMYPAPPPAPYRTDEDIAAEVVRLLRRADYSDHVLVRRVNEALGDRRWTRELVEACLDDVIDLVADGARHLGGRHLGEAMGQALDEATDVATDEFRFGRCRGGVDDGFATVVAVGILALMQGPWVLEFLGFGELRGDGRGARGADGYEGGRLVLLDRYRSGSIASWWAREYAAYIPVGSVDAFFRALGVL
ncbi:hypothetical protein B0H67DRAFT_578248 [Lasiosphaeris hirsuta]|uniref:Uncharacterized protein n=1 Tax=Lasiosphaeris hirsuta TaxID=260670 RepID=A0AA40DYI3_9PEZI|nr:hypothetical protein B0H67DRAFT_578248 [Lasiosphaeris hirsuta]